MAHAIAMSQQQIMIILCVSAHVSTVMIIDITMQTTQSQIQQQKIITSSNISRITTKTTIIVAAITLRCK